MRIRDLIQETFSALDANRGRSALTILGIVIGIGAVISMTALIGGVNNALVGELGLDKAQLVYISVYTERELTYSDVEKMQRDLTDYEYFTATSYGSADVKSETKKVSGGIQGVKPDYFKIMGNKFADGSAFTKADEAKGSMVAVIDKPSVRALFGSDDAEAVGKSLRIGNDQYTIVGVIESDMNSFSGEDYATVYAPFSTVAQRIVGNQSVSQILGFAREGLDMDDVVDKTKDYLAATYNISDEDRDTKLSVNSMKSSIDSAKATTGSFSMLMTIVASVSLLVGGIGIMNMMLTNVTERIREIGLRKALGARRSDITRQFMLESVCLCVMGGLLGVQLGFFGAQALAGLAADAFFAGIVIKPVVDLGTVAIAVGVCVGIGMLFGWYPARRAARLDPVESLHYQ